MSPLIQDWQLSAAAGPLFEDAVIALHLIVRGVPVRYPDLRILHCSMAADPANRGAGLD